ncbi:MAG: fibronectin type III domain-containing protein [Microbacteriaceae bacterium]|nr:fibronectin type III domain-containing protein [Microbacteriaceae bacterium]
MIGWLRGHLSLVVTTSSALVVGILISTLAVISGGYDRQRYQLGDGSVWVANSARQVIGRVNTEIESLDTVVPSGGRDLTVVQHGETVLAVDGVRNTVEVVDAATATVAVSVALPAPVSPAGVSAAAGSGAVSAPATDPGAATSTVALAGDNVVIHAARTGQIWILPLAALKTFDAAVAPTLTVGNNSVLSVSPRGILFAYSAAGKVVYRLDAAASVGSVQGSAVTRTPVTFGQVDAGPAAEPLAITSVGGQWVLLNRATGVLLLAGHPERPITGLVAKDSSVLQGAIDDGVAVVVASSVGLRSVPLDGSAPSELLATTSNNPGVGGVAVSPIIRAGCLYAAWSAGASFVHCANARSTISRLDGVPGDAGALVFSSNGDRVLLSDPRAGRSWAVQNGGAVIDNWAKLIAASRPEAPVDHNTSDTPPVLEKVQQPPVAVNDAFGARPGRVTVLPVLLNDFDANGDVLAVTETTLPQFASTGINAGSDTGGQPVATLSLISDRQQLQFSLTAAASGIISFGYTVSDGRGGTASAQVTVTVKPDTENSAPVQRRETRALVASGGRVSVPVLGDWVDPEGDPLYLSAAIAAAPNTLTFTPLGEVDFRDGGASQASGSSGDGRTSEVTLRVSDSRAEGAGVLRITASPSGQSSLIVEPFLVNTTVGRTVTIEPLQHVRGGSGEIRLTAVPAKPGSTIEPRLAVGTFQFSSVNAGTHYLDFVVTDGTQTATGVVRVDVSAPSDANATPLTVPHTVFIRALSQQTVELSASDIDPAGGVLLVTGVAEMTAASGIKAEILDHRAVRITLTAPLTAGPVAVGYRVSNGLAEAAGVITVVQIADPLRRQPPVANDDTATVRVGDAISIPVLQNDSQSDGELRLSSRLVRDVPSGSGLLFVSGNQLRYLAPETPGNFSAVYEVSGQDGQVAQAQLNIAVREVVAASNAAPVPLTVTARVVAGGSVRVHIPLSGIDPDGDSVQLLGQQSNPQRGAVTAIGADYLDYTAGLYSAGTDSFSYTVGDSFGARASATVRVGIMAPQNGSSNPVALADEVRSRPGITVTVPVLANDFDPDGGDLSVTAVVVSTAGIRAVITGTSVRITPPRTPGRYGLVYTIANELGGTSSNFITVVVDPLAPVASPVAADTVLALSDISRRDTVTVDVLSNVTFSEGAVSSLTLQLVPSAGGSDRSTARVTPNKRITVTPAARRQIIPFAVANPEDPTAVAYAFIWVPGLDEALPQLNRLAAPLTVVSGESLRIAVNDYVIAAANKRVRLVSPGAVQASHANGDPLVVDDTTLLFTSAPGYFGLASIAFEVTDAAALADPQAKNATLVLPIVVLPRVNQPPVFSGGVISFEPGEQKTIDLARLTSYPAPGNPSTLRFSITGANPADFDAVITGSLLSVSARSSAAKASSSSLSIAVGDDAQAGITGRLTLNVVASTRPLAQPVADIVIAPRGQVTRFDPLTNDEATNPFPGTPLRVVDLTAGSALPAGVSYTLASDGTVSVTVGPDAAPVDTTLQYRVADATADPTRESYGSVRISVQDRPDTPLAPDRADASYREGELTLRLTPPAANNAPILGYRVVSGSNGGYSAQCGTALRCVLSDLIPGQRYEFAVIATNSVGDSAPSALSTPLSADYLPAAPATVSAVPTGSNPAGAALLISWSAVADPSRGSPVSAYAVTVTGPAVQYSTLLPATATAFETTASNSLVANALYVVTVSARNDAAVLSAGEWRLTAAPPVVTIGPPLTPAGGVTAVSRGRAGTIVLNWAASDPNGAEAVRYSIGRFEGPPPESPCASPPAARGLDAGSGAAAVQSGWSDTRVVDGVSYSYVLYSENVLFCTATASAAVESRAAPGGATGETAVVTRDGKADLRVVRVGVSSGIAARFQVRVSGGAWVDTAGGNWLTSAADSSVYGTPQTVTFRGCRDDSAELCGTESAAQTLRPVNLRATIDSCVVGAVPQSTAPVNTHSPQLRFHYSYNDGSSLSNRWSPFVTDAAAPPPAPIGSGVTRVRLQAEVSFDPGGGAGASTTRDDGFDEASCDPAPATTAPATTAPATTRKVITR